MLRLIDLMYRNAMSMAGLRGSPMANVLPSVSRKQPTKARFQCVLRVAKRPSAGNEKLSHRLSAQNGLR